MATFASGTQQFPRWSSYDATVIVATSLEPIANHDARVNGATTSPLADRGHADLKLVRFHQHKKSELDH